jgi:hypothetical protein
MSERSLTSLKEEWQKTMEILFQTEDSLGLVIEKGKNSILDKYDKNVLSETNFLRRSNSNDLLSQDKESNYQSVLRSLEESIPAYNVSLLPLISEFNPELPQQ